MLQRIHKYNIDKGSNFDLKQYGCFQNKQNGTDLFYLQYGEQVDVHFKHASLKSR